MPMTRLMESVSPLPQNWLMSTEAPLWRPKMISRMTKMGMLARVTAAMGVSPGREPTMKVSTRARDSVMRF